MNDISRPRRRYGIWIVLAILVAGGGYYWHRQGKKSDAVTFETAPVTRGSLIESIASTGTLSALEEVTVGSQVSGNITKVLVDFNDKVKKGQLLAVVDPQTLQAQVDSSQATLAQRQVAYDEAVRQLDEGKGLMQQKYLADHDLRTLEVAVRTTKAQLDSAKVDFNKQTVQLAYAEIRSPIDGVIVTRSVDPGNTVQASMQAPTLFVVASDLTKMKILANVDETQIAQIKENMKARFTVSGIANKVFTATVRQVRLKPTTSNNVVTYTVVLDAANPENLLFPGMTATIDFILSSIDDSLLVPASALRVRIPDAVRVAADQQGQSSSSAGMGSAGQAGPVGQGVGQGGGGANFGGNGQRAGGFGGQGMNGFAGGGRPGLWMINAEGKAYRVPVRVLGSDLTNMAVQPMKEDSLKEGDAVIIKVNDGSARSGSSSSRAGGAGGVPGGPGGFGGGFGGMGPGG